MVEVVERMSLHQDKKPVNLRPMRVSKLAEYDSMYEGSLPVYHRAGKPCKAFGN